MDKEIEIWKDISRYEGYYQVSNFGNVKSLFRIAKCNKSSERIINEKLLKIYQYKDNLYNYIVLSKNGISKKYKLHRVIAKEFIENKLNLPFINHIDGVRTNNKIENLEWCTHSHNMKHKFIIGNDSNAKGKNAMAKKVIFNKTNEIFDCLNDAATHAKIDRKTLRLTMNGKNKNIGYSFYSR